MRTFSQELKTEICNQELDTKSAKYFLNGIVFNKLVSIDNSYLSYTTQYPKTIRFLKKILVLLDQELKDEITYTKKVNQLKKTEYELNFKLDQEILSLDSSSDYEDYMYAFFGGLFLSVGNVSSPDSKDHHLELVFNEEYNAILINNLLIQNGHEHFKLTTRKNKFVLYLKKVQEIINFIAYIKAFDCVFKYEDESIKRKIYSKVKSSNNLDIVNLTKTIDLNNKLKPMIETIIYDESFNEQTELFKRYCFTKLQNPSASLLELSSILTKEGFPITRTGLAHYNKKIKILYEQLKK
ncbi:DNA-binding protein WhiA [Mycoplasma bradburyae]|uniref:Probable cell division protein WhiA n=1 Tax=Mycoplasma bradburyae TaxID=2963128 RepID=A0AAW6HPA0_9MOLU|nr:DNA-binding protein WhiA [Mycoplasma bradburyae]MDC4163480.1 DNA-binding protein WhiA [Mycoplasma bradburyae]MDC4182082.1 DNA-binding protein WhiA [Mycoplasma bradburyae]MDC4182854.1 DNA-binding protein WhiA [Mycoplasma bradburyae]MDC4183529.1 DNA-binding protein WhiA [Mycoplasma bradburyae]MDC4184268.1 DNA-binding protein WhiA [Mycoplasma bradburyae]